MRKPQRTQAHTLAGAYALDAVTGADRARFERHLARCQACAAELRELREAAARLAAAVAADPPGGITERAVAAAARTRQWPPDIGPARGWRPAREWPVAWGRWQARGWRPARHALRARGLSRAPGSGGPGVSRRVALGLAAVFLAVAAASGAVAVTAEHHLGTDQARDHAIAEVLSAPDAVMLTARVTGGGTATVVTSLRDRALVFTADGLPSLPAGRYYQLWLMGRAGDRPAGLLPAPDHGMTGPVIATGVTAGDMVGLTAGPPSGHPASSPILMLRVT
jgi:anti-sigma factor RsiW